MFLVLNIGIVTNLSKGLEPLLDANIFSRIRRVGLLPEAERDARRRELILALMPADDVETNMQNNDILTISQKLASNRAHIGVVPPEIKEIYPILAACRDALEAVVLTSSPVAVSSIVAGLFLHLAHDEYRIFLVTLLWLSSGKVHVR